jgi:hypothetical protein
VPERRALLTGPIHPPLHRIDINKGQHLRAGQQGRLRREPGQHPAVHRGQLAHGAVGEGPQKRPQRRGSPDPTKARRERTQQVHPVDIIGTSDHPGHQRTDLHPRVRTDLRGHLHMLDDQIFQTDVLGQPQRRHQTGVRHQIRIIKPHARLGRPMQQSHLRSALSTMGSGALATPIFPGQRALLLIRHAPGHSSGGGSRLSTPEVCDLGVYASPVCESLLFALQKLSRVASARQGRCLLMPMSG